MLLSLPALAQSAESQTVAAPGFCWRARPLPRCASFPITDVTVTVPLVTTRTNPDPQFAYGDYPDFRSQMTWTVGMMRNRSATSAHGPSVSLRVSSGGDVSPAIEWRTRQWTGSRSFTELTAGYTQKEVFIRPPGVGQRIENVRAHGLTASAATAPIDLIGLVGRGDAVFTQGKVHYGVSVGAQTGSYGSAIATGALGVFLAIVIVALSGADF